MPTYAPSGGRFSSDFERVETPRNRTVQTNSDLTILHSMRNMPFSMSGTTTLRATTSSSSWWWWTSAEVTSVRP